MPSSVKSLQTWDAVIVGARCAGAATAMLLARAGLRVLVVDRDAYGSDTLSTHALMRTGVSMLHRWGLLDRLHARDTPLVRRTRFVYGPETLDLLIKPEDGAFGLCAPRRTVLDPLLVDAAREAGACFRFGMTATGLLRAASGRVTGVTLRDRTGREDTVRAGLVIGADGRQSMVAQGVGARVLSAAPAMTAGVVAYVGGIQNRGYRWFFQPGRHVAAIPTSHGDHCLCAIVPRAAYRDTFGSAPLDGFLATLGRFDPDLSAHASRAAPDLRLRRWAGAPGHLKECHGPGWALVGDAAHFKDPMTAHGITDALRDAELLARDVVTGGGPGNLSAYQAMRDQLSRPLFEVTNRIARFDWSLDELKAMHLELNAVMKAEHAAMMRSGALADRVAA